MKTFMIDESADDQRLDRYLKKLMPSAGKGEIQRWIRTKKIKLNGKRVESSSRVFMGDELNIYLPDPVIESYTKTLEPIAPEKSGLDIVYEDDAMLIVNKPVGLLVHPDKDEYKQTLSSYVQHYLRHLITPTFKPASVNRLDKNTSGLVIFGKTYSSLKSLNQKMRERQIKKEYQAIIMGNLNEGVVIKGYLTKDEASNRVKYSAQSIKGAKAIHTIVKPVAYKENFTRVEIQLLTGRTHQIRLSLSHIGHPIVGDVKYGGRRMNGVQHQLLHAFKLSFDNRIFTINSQIIDKFWDEIN